MGAAARGRWAGSSLRLGVEGGGGRGCAVPLRPREEGRGSSTSLLCLCGCRRGCVCPALGGGRRTGPRIEGETLWTHLEAQPA